MDLLRTHAQFVSYYSTSTTLSLPILFHLKTKCRSKCNTITMSAEYENQDPIKLAQQAERDLNSAALKQGKSAGDSSTLRYHPLRHKIDRVSSMLTPLSPSPRIRRRRSRSLPLPRRRRDLRLRCLGRRKQPRYPSQRRRGYQPQYREVSPQTPPPTPTNPLRLSKNTPLTLTSRRLYKAGDFEGLGGPEDKAAAYAEAHGGADAVRGNVRQQGESTVASDTARTGPSGQPVSEDGPGYTDTAGDNRSRTTNQLS